MRGPRPAAFARPRPPSPARALTLTALLTGCGAAGEPRPPGPVPPGPPAPRAAISTPDAIVLPVDPPAADLDGRPFDDPVTLHAHPAADCQGAPIARGADGELRLPPFAAPTAIRVVALRAGHAGTPSAPVTVQWVAPPPPPEAPLAFVDAAGAVQLSWLPPPPPVEAVRIARDGAVVAVEPADAALWTDAAPPGRHVYTLIGEGPGFRTGSSGAAVVEVR